MKSNHGLNEIAINKIVNTTFIDGFLRYYYNIFENDYIQAAEEMLTKLKKEFGRNVKYKKNSAGKITTIAKSSYSKQWLFLRSLTTDHGAEKVFNTRRLSEKASYIAELNIIEIERKIKERLFDNKLKITGHKIDENGKALISINGGVFTFKIEKHKHHTSVEKLLQYPLIIYHNGKRIGFEEYKYLVGIYLDTLKKGY